MRQAHRATIAIAILLFLLAGSASAAGYSHIRDAWVYGLNLGWGWTQVKAHDIGNDIQATSPWVGDFTGALRAGFCPSESFSYGIDFSGWTDYAGRFDTRVFYFLLQGHWYPQGQGFYVRGGAGLGSLGVTQRGTAFPVVSKSSGGFAWGAGAGYELRVSPNFAFGVAYDYRWVGVGQITDQIDDVSAGTQGVTLSMNWYMD